MHNIYISTPRLFPDLEGDEGPTDRPTVDLGPPPRLRRPDREQMLMRPCALDELLGDDHDARLVWGLVETWDLSPFLDTVRGRGEAPGRSATDPKLLVALWLYAATQGVAGGRELARLCGGAVTEQLVDGGYVKLGDLDRSAASDPAVTLYMPVPKPRKGAADPHQAKATDSDAVAGWRLRMGTPEAKEIDKGRASTVETVNAELKTERGLKPFRVRGLPKVRCVALWCALA